MKNISWLSSYPRSGNTWFRIFLSALLSGKKSFTDLNRLHVNISANSRTMFDDCTGLNSSELTNNEINNLKPTVYQMLSQETEELIFVKTHEKYMNNSLGKPLFPGEISVGSIYIIRNPLDVAVSNAFYFQMSIDETIHALNSPTFTLNPQSSKLYPVLQEKIGTWSEHVTAWYNSGLNVHFLRYEDLTNNPYTTFSKALDFLGLHFSDQKIREAILASSFEKLKKTEEKTGFKEKLQKCDQFFRQGKTGNWKNILTQKQVSRIITKHHKTMQQFGYLDEDKKVID